MLFNHKLLRSMTIPNQIYSVYIADTLVELRSLENSAFAHGRFICSETNYHNILKLATNLARHKRMPLKDYTSIKN